MSEENFQSNKIVQWLANRIRTEYAFSFLARIPTTMRKICYSLFASWFYAEHSIVERDFITKRKVSKKRIRYIFDFWSLNDGGNMQLPPYHSISYHTTIKYYRTVASLTIIRIFLHENWNDARVENVEYLLSKKHNIYKVHVQIVCSLIILASTTRVVTIRWLHVRCFFSSTYLALAFSYVP